jgi:YD repeat-containing protein
MNWRQSRSWTNGPGYDAGGALGPGWVESSIPSLTQVGDSVVLIVDGNNALYFDETATADVYQERFFGQNALVDDDGTFVLTSVGGAKFEFNDFSASPEAIRGQMISITDSGGNVTDFDRDESGALTTVSRGDDAEEWAYTYVDGKDANAGKLESVALTRAVYEMEEGEPVVVSHDVVRKIIYSYYADNEDYGNLGDLKSAVLKEGDENVLSTQYYRYYKNN